MSPSVTRSSRRAVPVKPVLWNSEIDPLQSDLPCPAAPADSEVSAVEPLSLLQRMRAGDQGALQQLHGETVHVVYAQARAILRNPEDAEEVVSDTFAQAWRQSERFDAARGSAKVWLLMICRGRALDRLRHNRCRMLAHPPSSVFDETVEDCSPTLDANLQLIQDNSALREVLATLSPLRIELIGLAFFQELSYPEISRRTGLPLGTVKSHVRRALIELRRALQATDADPLPQEA